MRIECDKCAAKYSIADEKVRGKTFKIRCKKCSNVIIVRDKAAGAEDAAASEPASSDEPAGWHLAIDGDTVGPLSEDEVRRRYEAGQVDKSTSVWQEGFEDWIELGQVEAFANLPDRANHDLGGAAAGLAAGGMAAGLGAAAAADDPFASSGSDDAFAASSGSNFDSAGGGGFGAEPEPAAEPAASEPAAVAESPRVDPLTGQRNENSVLFSLDSLKAMASSQKPASAGPVRQAPSTTAPSSEGSGLIDIRAMGAMMDAPAASSGGGGGGGGAEDDMLPTFGGGGLGGLSVEPLVTEPPPATAPAVVESKRSTAPMYILIGLLAAGLIGLGVLILTKEEKDPQVIEKVVQVPGAVQDKDEDKDKDKDEDKDKDKDEDKDDAGKEDDAGETEGAAEAGEESPGKTTKKSTTKKSSTSGGSAGVAGSTGGGSSSGGSSGGGSSSGGAAPKDPDVDCLLDPNLPKCKGGGKSSSETKSAPDPSLPAKLGTTQIKTGIDGVKNAAKACGGKNGAAPGTKVAIKFSVKGSTGSVISATATGEHAGTALGKCVEAEAKKAKFPKFQADQQGFQFNFRM